MPEIRVYHSFRSPYSRLGLHLLKNAGLEAELIAFTGPPEGVAFQDPVQNAPKLAYYLQDAPRMTMRMGLPIRPPQPFEVDLSAANNAFAAASKAGKGLDYAIAVSDARWGEGRDVSDMSVLETCAENIGWNADAVRAAQNDENIADAHKHYRSMIERDQVFGVPFAVYGDCKFWGHDRFELLIEEATK